MHKIEAVIFDMDGLILDTERLALPALRRAGESIGITLTDDILTGMIGLDEHDANIFMEKNLGISVPQKEFSDAFYKDYEETISTKGIPLKAGLIELIDFLEDNNIKTAIATSTKTQLALKKLKLSGIGDRFQTVIGSDQVIKGKPSPDIYLKAANILNIPTDNCLALEDSDNGALSAIAAEIKVIVVPDIKPPSNITQKNAFGIYDSLFEVREYLREAITDNS